MSWLFVVFIPALLMLAAVGLGRLETSLTGDTVSAADVEEFLQQAESGDVDTLARDGMSDALDGLHRRLNHRDTPVQTVARAVDQPGLPTRVYVHRAVNPEFQRTPHANRV